MHHVKIKTERPGESYIFHPIVNVNKIKSPLT